MPIRVAVEFVCPVQLDIWKKLSTIYPICDIVGLTVGEVGVRVGIKVGFLDGITVGTNVGIPVG